MIATSMHDVRGIIIGAAAEVRPIKEGDPALTIREITIEFENGTRTSIDLFSRTSDLSLEIK